MALLHNPRCERICATGQQRPKKYQIRHPQGFRKLKSYCIRPELAELVIRKAHPLFGERTDKGHYIFNILITQSATPRRHGE